MTDLEQYRQEIDRIDSQMVRLFEERMKVSEAVAEYKIQAGRQVLDPERERVKIASVREKAHGDFNKFGVQELFRQIMAISRKRQYQLLNGAGLTGEESFTEIQTLPKRGVTVVFQGVKGAYSYGAMRTYFEEDIKSYHVPTFRDAMEEVAGGRADFAVLPIENSTAGIVADIYDLLMEFSLYIVGEQILKVEHVLLGLPEASLEDVKKVYSHPQGLSQCRKYLEGKPCWKQVEEENTAGAAKKISQDQDPSQAAIASRQAGEVYGLKVLAEHICENQENCTRFIILGRKPVYEKDAGKVSICFEAVHESGALYNMLSHIIYNGLNMTKIESRPLPGRNWEYRFFVDFDGNLKGSSVKNALRGIREEANAFRILGNYGASQGQDM